MFARQQRHQPHLLEIHPHRIVQRVEVAGFNLVLFRFFGRIHLRMIHDFNFQLAELRKNFIQRFRSGQRFRQRLVNIVEREVPLFLGKVDELFDFCRQFLHAIRRRYGCSRNLCRGGHGVFMRF